MQIYGGRWDTPKSAEGVGGSAHQTTFYNLLAVLANREGPSWLDVSEYDSHLPEGQEGRSRELQTYQSDFGAGELKVKEVVEVERSGISSERMRMEKCVLFMQLQW